MSLDSSDNNHRLNHQAEGVGGKSDQDELAHRAANMLPDEILDSNEIIILLTKPSLFSIVAAPLATLISLLVLTIIAIGINDKWGFGIERQTLIILGSGLIALRIFWQFLEWLTQVYVLTDRRIIRVQGMFKTSIYQAPLIKITNTKVRRSFREKIFGLGSIIFTVSGSVFEEGSWAMLSFPNHVYETINQTIQRYRGK